MPSIKTKRVYDLKRPDDGMRVLVMRLWPRGIKKSHVHLWLKELGAPLPLLKGIKAGRLFWPAFQRGYWAHLRTPSAQPPLRRVAGIARRRTVTLLCSCADESRCHRSILKRVLKKNLRGPDDESISF